MIDTAVRSDRPGLIVLAAVVVVIVVALGVVLASGGDFVTCAQATADAAATTPAGEVCAR